MSRRRIETVSALSFLRTTLVADSDGDGLPDSWEEAQFGNLAETGEGDPDGDTLNNRDELSYGADPNKKDTDGDSLEDGAEVLTHGSSPALADRKEKLKRDQQEMHRVQGQWRFLRKVNSMHFVHPNGYHVSIMRFAHLAETSLGRTSRTRGQSTS